MILSSIDCGAFNEVNLAKSRYGKVIIFTDADPDGENIAVLLLSFFTNVVPELIENGYIYLALPPLYGTHYKGEFIPINNEETKNYYLRKGYSITRYKGLGEMPPNELAISCMNKDTRNIVKVEKSDNYKEFISKVAGGDSSYRKKLLIEAGVLYE
jgi:DNA gyrase/topoisomerase IV subunit B